MSTQTTHDERPLIVLVSSGYHLYREYLLKLVAGASRVWLFLSQEPTWELPHIVGHTLVDTLDSAAMIAAARDLHARTPLRGVLCWDEVRMVQCAEVAQALGLPGGDPEVMWRCRDKHRTRTSLAAAGVPSAASLLVSSLEQARAAARSIGYPVVLKPRALGASFGVSLAASPEELEAAFQNARTATEDGVPYFEEGVLVEEYMHGPEISCDSSIIGGKLRLLVLARKVSAFPPHFEEIGHVVDAGDPLREDARLLDVLERAHQAVGFTDGITHTELRLTAAGPKIVEINCRLGGGLIPYVGYVASGIDPGRVAVEAACGIQGNGGFTRRRVAAIHFFYPSRDLKVAGIEVDRTALPPSVHLVGVLAQPGQELLLPPAGHVTSRYAYAIGAADSLADCQAALDAAARAITLRAADGHQEAARVLPPA